MPKDPRSAVHLDVAPGESRSVAREPDDPFRILVLGDFSGRGNRRVREPLAGRRPVLIDRDNVDEVLAAMRPAVRVSGMTIEFGELDDFHPDALYRRIPVFRELAESRERPMATAAPVAPRRPPQGGSLLDEMLDESSDEDARVEDATDLAAFIKRVTAGQVVEREDPRKQQHRAEVDTAASRAMRAILHDSAFQALEAGWRSLDFLVRRLETGEFLKVYVLDATLQEVVGDPRALLELFAGQGTDWALIAGNYRFGSSAEEAAALRRIGQAAQAANAPFLAEAGLPSEDAPEEWSELRRSPEARWIGLALPRFALRLPYGAETSSIESFPFEEMPESEHSAYLWGNPAFCCVELLGESFTADGWEMRPGSRRSISGLPLHAYTEEGESQLKPCAEVWMKEKDAEYLMEQGIMPLASMKGQDAVLLVRFQSIADSVRALAGKWAGV
jgi:type VI secretion system protein ImpC